MEIIIFIVVLALLFFYLGHTEFSFNPFYIKVHTWWRPVGFFLIMLGIEVITQGEYFKGLKDGREKANDTFKEVLKDSNKEENNEQSN